jgi:MFS transporter, DHA1 family, multidrug resistance protein
MTGTIMSFPPVQTRAGPGHSEFVLLIATVMMTIAFAIDSMLPALPAIGDSLGVVIENERQFVITAFMIGFGIAQFFVGTLSDRYGRRGLLLLSMAGYAVFSLMAALAPTFELLLLARAAQGMAAAGGRVLVAATVRDRFSGREMAQVMSVASVVFMAAPILAPTLGTIILAVAPWRWIFAVLAFIGVCIWFWVWLRLPESLAVDQRVPISIRQLRRSWKRVLTDPQSTGYTLAMTCMTGALMGFLTSVQQVFDKIFHRPDFLPYGFAIMAAGMAAASLINSRIVMRFGMRLIGHSALIGFTAFAGIHAAIAVAGAETLVSFIGLQTLMMMCFSLSAANFGAMAVENVGDVAGTANSLQGSFSTIIGAMFGAFIGQSFNGTTVPLYTGYFICGVIALVAVFVTEGGHLFVARNAPQPAGE